MIDKMCSSHISVVLVCDICSKIDYIDDNIVTFVVVKLQWGCIGVVILSWWCGDSRVPAYTTSAPTTINAYFIAPMV